MEFEQTEKQLSESDLKIFEEKFQINLPDAFKEHYLISNGGYPPFEYVKGVERIFTINGFNPIKYGSLTIEQIILDYKKNGIAFEKKIPFAYDNGGNIFFISADGSVCIAEAEFAEDENYILVSRSFTDFITSFFNE